MIVGVGVKVRVRVAVLVGVNVGVTVGVCVGVDVLAATISVPFDRVHEIEPELSSSRQPVDPALQEATFAKASAVLPFDTPLKVITASSAFGVLIGVTQAIEIQIVPDPVPCANEHPADSASPPSTIPMTLTMPAS